jgi:hypothetical protein
MNSIMNVSRLALAAVLALSIGACGGQPSAPAASPVAPTASTPAPTPAPTPTPAGGATVTGSVAIVSGPTGLRALTASSSSYTVVVSVAGTSLSTAVDGTGRFKLTGVPSGTIELRFSGGGMQGSIMLTGVKDADEIDVAVTLSSSGAALTPPSDAGGEVQLEGRIAELNPGGVASTLLVDGTTVSVPAGADIRHGDTPIAFSALQVGDRVHVKGTKNGQTLVASQLIVQNTNTTVPVNVTGAVSLLQSGFTCPAIRFTVGGWTVETSAATDFQKGTCSSVANGTSVHVKGDVQASGRVLATWVQVGK